MVTDSQQSQASHTQWRQIRYLKINNNNKSNINPLLTASNQVQTLGVKSFINYVLNRLISCKGDTLSVSQLNAFIRNVSSPLWIREARGASLINVQVIGARGLVVVWGLTASFKYNIFPPCRLEDSNQRPFGYWLNALAVLYQMTTL
jgi:hypothetical protein